MAPEGQQPQQHETAQQAGVSLAAIQANTKQLAAACASLKAQREARAANVNPTRPDESQLGRLDSSVKKNGTFIKKLRALGSDNGKQLLAEAAKLNLSKYVSEAIIALSEAPLKNADIPAVVVMASALHQRYPDFAASLGPTLGKVAAGSAAKAGTDEERLAARRQRGALRLLPELIAVGVVPDASPLLGAIKSLVVTLDFAKAPEPSLTAATLLGSCIKAAAPLLLGAAPDTTAAAAGGSSGGSTMPLPQELLRTKDLSGLPADLAAAVTELQQQQQQLEQELKSRYQLPDETRGQLLKLFDHAFDACSAALIEAHKALITLDKDNARAYATKGELPEGAAAEYEASRKSYEALHRGVSAMAEALDKPLPHLAEDAFTRIGHEEAAAAGGAGSAGGAGEAVEHVFEDPEVRAFYEQLPDLWSLVPTVLLKDATRPRVSESSGSKPADAADAAAAPSTPTAAEAAAAAAAAGGAEEGSSEAAGAAAAAGSSSQPPPAAAAGEGSSETAEAAAAADAGAEVTPDVQGADLVLSRLSTCVSRDLCDELAVNFCYSNSKGARKRLVRALLDVPRGNLQLLPYYARVAATISQAYPEVGAGVASAVESEFDALAAKKDMTRAGEEPRLRVARYLAELVKFRLAAPNSLLLRLKALLDDFSGPHVEAATTLVENAGRFLLRLPESRVRMENLLAVMMRLRNARNLDSRQTNAIDNAYFACRPPDKAASRRRKRTPMQEYIHHLIFERLGDGSIVDVLKKLMKLPWSETEPYLLKCLLKVVRVRFQHIALIASLAGGLAQYHDSLGVGLVDMVLEDVRWGLDHPFAGNYQQRLAQVRLLGESYNYMLLDSRAVFDVLYTLIGYGHDNEATALKLDPPDDFFRLRMVIVLLNTCGSYFSKGAAKRRLDRFLTFLQAYVLAKQAIPLDVDADLQDMYDVLRPGLVRFSSYPEACAAVSDILAKEAAATASGLEPIDEDDEDSEEEAPKADDAVLSDEYEDDDDDGGGDGIDEYDRGEGAAGATLDDEFEREYLSLMQECQGRPGGSLAGGPCLLPMPAGVSNSSSSSHQQQQDPQNSHQQQEQQQQHGLLLRQQQQYVEYDDEGPSVTFKMLMKRGGKDDRTKELHVPADAALAARVLAKKESEEAERSQIKALVLEANERDEAEQQAAAAAARAARAAAFRRGGRGSGQQSLYRQRAPGRGPGGRKQPQQGPQLTLSQHVSQLTGGQH